MRECQQFGNMVASIGDTRLLAVRQSVHARMSSFEIMVISIGDTYNRSKAISACEDVISFEIPVVSITARMSSVWYSCGAIILVGSVLVRLANGDT